MHPRYARAMKYRYCSGMIGPVCFVSQTSNVSQLPMSYHPRAQAANFIKHAAELEPKRPEEHLVKAWCNLFTGHFAEMVQPCLDGLMLYPSHPSLCFVRISCFPGHIIVVLSEFDTSEFCTALGGCVRTGSANIGQQDQRSHGSNSSSVRSVCKAKRIELFAYVGCYLLWKLSDL